MNRLTMKISNANNFCKYELKNAKYRYLFDLKSNKQIEDYVDANLTIAIDELGQLEDIEEELGIELPDMFNIYEKICKQNFVYIIENEKIIKEDLGSVRHLINPKEKQFEAIYLDAIATYKFVDYGKKWALTREELEND